MEDVVEKLRLLDYETRFCGSKGGFKPLARTYFAMPSNNPNEQFTYFISLVAWLMGVNGQNVSSWSKYDDPNTAVNNVVLELKKLGVDVDFPPAKLKTGSGEAVCTLLDALLNRTLERMHFQFRKPVFKEEPLADEAEIDEDAEINTDAIDEAVAGEEEEALYTELVQGGQSPSQSGPPAMQAVLVSTVDPQKWNMELEKVAPFLRVEVANDSKEWRTHLEQTKQYEETIKNTLPECKAQLVKLADEVNKALERITSKEKHINNQFDHMAGEFRKQQGDLATVTVRYNQISENVSQLTNEMSRITEQLDTIKAQMDDRSNNMTDTSPLVKIKQALQKLKGDIRSMELRIGVVSHTLLQSKMKEKPSTENGVRSGIGADTDMDLED
eukprot:GILK01001986.1.p1 GENE.GILK01001986.1~~GILK01001986.1.p1  ORF type:complete len:443 (-),score=105.37 GILK01001986.1:107-1261(-)